MTTVPDPAGSLPPGPPKSAPRPLATGRDPDRAPGPIPAPALAPATTDAAALPLTWRTRARALGPGLIGGASDVDPTTVATLAVVGAGTTYSLGWLTLLLFPLLGVIQAIATRVGIASRLDLQGAIGAIHGSTVRWLLLGSVIIVNVITIAADLEAGAAAVGLLTGADWRWFVAPLSIVLLLAILTLGYQVLQRALRYLLLLLLLYAAAALMARPDWSAVARGTFVPHLTWDSTHVYGAMSLIGTTATSYVYVWQTISQSETHTPWAMHRLRRFDALVGCFFATLVCWFILVAAGATLGVGHLPVNTADEAAQALRPVAGPFAESLFAIGLLASTVVALPVIVATTAYMTGTHLNWTRGLSLRPRQAPRFFGAMAAAVLLGTIAGYSSVSPMTILYWAGVFGAVGTPVGLILLLRAATNRTIMGTRTVGRPLLAAGWAMTALIIATSAAGLIQLLTG
ncbi:NRAMP family divalent metal transporter (plasmid) [Streptomyces sp. BI20]|uniref:NRAMP family divalent metal transporter n=1 Tax=Streptomyces sp. BI20 TaxID=3403460 RepID=UPI003C745D6C